MDILQGIERVSKAIEALSNEVKELKLSGFRSFPVRAIFGAGRKPGA